MQGGIVDIDKTIWIRHANPITDVQVNYSMFIMRPCQVSHSVRV